SYFHLHCKKLAKFFSAYLDDDVRRIFKKAAKQWMDSTCVDFKENECVNRIFFVQIKIAAHEIGHALGFFHTHSRHDRDDYITPNKINQYQVKSKADNNNYGVPYDYGSVMPLNELEEIFFRSDSNYTETLGSPFISFYDIYMMNLHYNCLERCEGVNTRCRNGGYAHPRACYKCVCPHGYGGKLCSRRVNVFSSSNSTIFRNAIIGLRSVISRKKLQAVLSIIHLKAPKGRKIQVKFVDFTKGADTDGCQLAGVEIKTNEDPGLTGYRYEPSCSSN
ncbi:unnamed protein product, partial [Haemonchus placei]|uniref:ZnMc domain-containing protein n=1 Tax=Haemonchus placei TaxID=6290 RepID=A0A0N4X4D3_HAEPC